MNDTGSLSPTGEAAYLDDLRRRQLLVWPADTPREPSYPFGEIPVTEYLRIWATTAPDRAVISFYGRDLSFAELDEAADQFMRWLELRGVRSGDRVAVLLPNCPQFVIAFYGILRLGAVYVPVNPLFREHELVHELVDAGAEVMIALNTLAPLVETVRSRVQLRDALFVALDDYLPASPTSPIPGELRAPLSASVPESSWGEVLSLARATRRSGDIDALAALNYTGGTMGLPKGCQHTQRNMLYTAASAAGAWQLGARFGGTEEDTAVVFLPVFWIAGEDLAVIFPVVTGTRCVLMTRWDPGAALAAIDRYRVTHVGGTVDSFAQMLEHPERASYDASSVRVPLAASFMRKLDVEVRRAWQGYAGAHSVIRECAFGMTETHTMDTSTTGFQEGDADLCSRPVFCGLPMPGTEIKVVDFESGQLLPVGSEGEIAIRTPSLFKGYWRSPEQTAKALRNGWLHTGDVGMLDDDGCLHFLGRSKEMIKVNGMSVFPAELETLLGMHPAVQAAAVVPREDSERGQVPVAFVEILDGATAHAEGLTAWARENMASYKVPEVRLTAALPRTDTGKVKKGELLERVREDSR